MRPPLALSLAVVLALALPASAPGQEGGAALKAGRIESRLKSVETLVETSSLAARIKSSGNGEAEALRLDAAGALKRAGEAYSAGDTEKAGRELIEAEKLVFKAVRLLGGDLREDKRRKDFDHRLKSIRALLDANRRVGAESADRERRDEIASDVAARMERAMALYDEGRAEEGRAELDAAYDAATESLREMRKGMTKVRDLKFETKEEEYDFVRRFNDDYLELAEKFINEYLQGSVDQEIAGKMKQYFGEGRELRKLAEEKAGHGDFEGGIETLDESTRRIKKAIRVTGFMIP